MTFSALLFEDIDALSGSLTFTDLVLQDNAGWCLRSERMLNKKRA